MLAENAGSRGFVPLLLHTLSVVVHGCNPNPQEVEEGGREVQGQQKKAGWGGGGLNWEAKCILRLGEDSGNRKAGGLPG